MLGVEAVSDLSLKGLGFPDAPHDVVGMALAGFRVLGLALGDTVEDPNAHTHTLKAFELST